MDKDVLSLLLDEWTFNHHSCTPTSNATKGSLLDDWMKLTIVETMHYYDVQRAAN